MSGAYSSAGASTVENYPSSISDVLEEKQRLSVLDIRKALQSPSGIKSLSFCGKIFENSATLEILAEQLQQSTGLEAIEFVNCTGVAEGALASVFREVLRTLCGCEELQLVRIAGCGLKASDASFLANEVAAWTKSVTEWDLSDNPLIGSNGVLEFIAALNGSSVLRLGLSNVGINDSRSGAAILSEVLGLSHLVSLGISRNAGITVSVLGGGALTEVEDFLLTNADMMGLDSSEHISLITALENEEKEAAAKKALPKSSPAQSAEEDAEGEASGGSTTTKNKKLAGGKPSSSVSGGTVRRGVSPSVSSSGPNAAASKTTVRRADSPAAQQPPSTTSIPSAKSIRRGASPVTKQPTTQRATTPSGSSSSIRRVDSNAGEASHQSRARSSTPTTLKRASSGARLGSSQPSLSASQTIAQREVTDGYEYWKEIKAKYNEYISCGVKKKKTPEEEAGKPAKPAFYTYKYAFGKPVDKMRESGSRRASTTTLIRDPTPQELRTIAPWIVDRNYVSSPGRVILVDDPTVPGGKIKFIDGGELRAVENDPREIGYVARKRESGQLSAARSGGFASTTPREVRFGTDATNQIIRWAQAPGPGHYVVKSEFEIAAEKAKINASNRPAFGSRSERIAFNKVKVDPKEAEKPVILYEIP